MDVWGPDREPQRPAWFTAIPCAMVFAVGAGLAAFAIVLGIGAGLRVMGWW